MDKQTNGGDPRSLPSIEGAVCPVPLSHDATIVLGHGSGGKLTQSLIETIFYPPLENETLMRGDDAAVLPENGEGRIAVSTDAHIVSPLFFPGGDIGKLAVCGSVNDLAMVGAVPRWITASFILEEGFPVSQLVLVLESMRAAAAEAGVRIVAGDTKVTERGKGDGLFITTTGIGVVPEGLHISGSSAQPGDKVLVSGDVGDHGIAVLAARGDLAFEADLLSDVAPLNNMVEAMLEVDAEIHSLRDPTRGGLATTLNEIARQSGVCISLDEESIPLKDSVRAACEMLGLDPLYIANEGKLVAIVAPEGAQAVLKALQAHPYGRQAQIIGEVQQAPHGRLLVRTGIGGRRVIGPLAGEILPRIC
ncbi:MAG: hydrogenase expression/formation protein HypE [Anaerolineales bacterium]